MKVYRVLDLSFSECHWVSQLIDSIASLNHVVMQYGTRDLATPFAFVECESDRTYS